MRAIRKQLYISSEHNQKLKRLARSWGCTEAAIVRRALDELPEPEPSPDDVLLQRLRAAGLIVSFPEEPSSQTIQWSEIRLAGQVGPKTRSARTQNGWCRPGTGS